jgi:hypothetical protein
LIENGKKEMIFDIREKLALRWAKYAAQLSGKNNVLLIYGNSHNFKKHIRENSSIILDEITTIDEDMDSTFLGGTLESKQVSVEPLAQSPSKKKISDLSIVHEGTLESKQISVDGFQHLPIDKRKDVSHKNARDFGGPLESKQRSVEPPAQSPSKKKISDLRIIHKGPLESKQNNMEESSQSLASDVPPVFSPQNQSALFSNPQKQSKVFSTPLLPSDGENKETPSIVSEATTIQTRDPSDASSPRNSYSPRSFTPSKRESSPTQPTSSAEPNNGIQKITNMS